MKHKFYKGLAVITFLVAILTSLTPGVALADTVPYEDQEVFNGMESTASIIETSAGTLLMVGQNEMTVDLQDPTKILASFSTDGGYTWSTPVDLELPITGNTQMYRMPNLLKLASGRILLILNRRVTYGGGIPAVCYSDDDGETWSTPVKLTDEQDTKTYLMNDRARLLSSGRIVVPVARGFNESVEGVGTKVASYYSDDNGATWDRSDYVSYTTDLSKRGVQEPAVVELTNGNLLMVMRTGENYLYQSISTDEGESWSTPTAMSLQSPCAPVNMRRAPDGQILIAWNNAPRASEGSLYPRHPLTCAVSDDEGQTWSNYCNIEDSTYDCAYPSIWFTDDDVIFTYYTTQSGYPYYSTKKTIISQSIVLDGVVPEPSTMMLDQDWDSLGGWYTYGSTVEISPSGQLHIEDDNDTVTQANKFLAIPSAYCIETKAKVDDYTTTAGVSFGTKVIDGEYRLMLVLKSDGIYMIDSLDTLVKKKSITMDNDWHTYKAIVSDGQADVYMDDVYQFSSSIQEFDDSQFVAQWAKSASNDSAEVHVDYTQITNSIVGEQWDSLTEWSIAGSTAEISPTGQLHLQDSSDTETKAYRTDVIVPTTYTMETYTKVDDYTSTASLSFATKIMDGTYQLVLGVKSDGIYLKDSSGSLVKKESITMDTDWHTYRAVVDDGEARVYMDGEYLFTSSMYEVSGSDAIEQSTQSASQNSAEVHVDHLIIKHGKLPGNFSLSSPTSGTTKTTISPQLSWGASSGADTYQVVIADNDEFSDPIIANSQDTSFYPSGLESNTTYYWKVIAKNAVGNTEALNNYFTFTTGIMDEQWDSLTGWDSSGSTVEISPTGQLHLSDSSDTITKAYSSDIAVPSIYTLEMYAKIDDFTTTASTSFGTKIMDGSYRLMLVMKSDGIYLIDGSGSLVKKKSITMDTDWHAYRAVVDDGEVEVYMDEVYQFTSSMQTLAGSDLVEQWTHSADNDTSEVHIDYTTIKYGNPPKRFELESPDYGDTEVNTTTALIWETPVGAHTYHVVVADNANFANPIYDTDNSNVPSFVLPDLDRNTTYYWKIIARNLVGETLASNAPFTFTTGILDEQWDSSLSGWEDEGSTVEISPSGQLHLQDSNDVTTKAFRTDVNVPGTYTIETSAKVDDFTTLGSTSFGTKVIDGEYRLMLVIKSDGIYMIDSSDTLVKKKSISIDNDWHTYKVLVEDGEAEVYMDAMYQFTSSIQEFESGDLIEQWTASADNDTSEVHINYTIAY